MRPSTRSADVDHRHGAYLLGGFAAAWQDRWQDALEAGRYGLEEQARELSQTNPYWNKRNTDERSNSKSSAVRCALL